jgi:hypothetical protein
VLWFCRSYSVDHRPQLTHAETEREARAWVGPGGGVLSSPKLLGGDG